MTVTLTTLKLPIVKFAKFSLPLWIAFSLAASIAGHPVYADGNAAPIPIPNPVHFMGVITAPDGKPAPDATILYFIIDPKSHTVVSEQTLHPTPTGAFDITWTWDPKNFKLPVIYVTAPEGNAIVDIDFKPIIVTLEPVTSVQVHLLGDDSRPVAHVRVCPLGFIKDHRFAQWDEAILAPLSAVTDENGRATLTGLPQGWAMKLNVADPTYVQPSWNQNILLAKAAITPEATLRVSHGGSLSGTIAFGPTQKPAPKFVVRAQPTSPEAESQTAVTDASGHYQMPRIASGTYHLWLEGSRGANAQDWTALKQTATVTAGSATTGIDFTLIHGGVLSGSVTEPKTGKPLPQVSIYIIGPAGQQMARTDDQGHFTLHVPPGIQRIGLMDEPGMTPGKDQSVELGEGETKIVSFHSTPPLHLGVVEGIVIGPDGKPTAGAHVTAMARSQQEQDTLLTTDAQGKFVFSAPGIMPDMQLYANAGRMTTPTGTLALSGKPITLRLVAHAQTVVRGTVTDHLGKAIAGVSVMLFRQIPAGIGGIGIDTTTTDATGKFVFTPAIPDAVYSADARAKGFESGFTKQMKSTPGKPLNFPALILSRPPPTDSFAGGTVTDINGKPIAGAIVTTMYHRDKRVLTDKGGRFHIGGATRGTTRIEVQAPGDRSAAVDVASGRDDNTVTAISQEEQEAESKRFLAARDADPTIHGDGTKALLLLHAACSQAGQSGKKVLLVFGASWCGGCFLLHHFLKDPFVRPVIEAHFVVQDIDIWEHKPHQAWENPGGVALYGKYGGIKRPGHFQGVPYFAVLDAFSDELGDARQQGENIGYPQDVGARDFFIRTLKAAAPDLTSAEAATLKAGLLRDARIE